MLLIIAYSTCLLGTPYQWTSDITEHCHITHVKTPYRMSNHYFHSQCVLLGMQLGMPWHAQIFDKMDYILVV